MKGTTTGARSMVTTLNARRMARLADRLSRGCVTRAVPRGWIGLAAVAGRRPRRYRIRPILARYRSRIFEFRYFLNIPKIQITSKIRLNC
jgi:hypothetical protein